jgi:hypothetical protein
VIFARGCDSYRLRVLGNEKYSAKLAWTYVAVLLNRYTIYSTDLIQIYYLNNLKLLIITIKLSR